MSGAVDPGSHRPSVVMNTGPAMHGHPLPPGLTYWKLHLQYYTPASNGIQYPGHFMGPCALTEQHEFPIPECEPQEMMARAKALMKAQNHQPCSPLKLIMRDAQGNGSIMREFMAPIEAPESAFQNRYSELFPNVKRPVPQHPFPHENLHARNGTIPAPQGNFANPSEWNNSTQWANAPAHNMFGKSSGARRGAFGNQHGSTNGTPNGLHRRISNGTPNGGHGNVGATASPSQLSLPATSANPASAQGPRFSNDELQRDFGMQAARGEINLTRFSNSQMQVLRRELNEAANNVTQPIQPANRSGPATVTLRAANNAMGNRIKDSGYHQTLSLNRPHWFAGGSAGQPIDLTAGTDAAQASAGVAYRAHSVVNSPATPGGQLDGGLDDDEGFGSEDSVENPYRMFRCDPALPAEVQRVLDAIRNNFSGDRGLTGKRSRRPVRIAVYNELQKAGVHGHFGPRGDLLGGSSLRNYTLDQLGMTVDLWNHIDYKFGAGKIGKEMMTVAGGKVSKRVQSRTTIAEKRARELRTEAEGGTASPSPFAEAVEKNALSATRKRVRVHSPGGHGKTLSLLMNGGHQSNSWTPINAPQLPQPPMLMSNGDANH